MAGEAASVIDTTSLGRRVVEAARLAVAVHLFESLSAGGSSHYGRRIGIGGAGPIVPGAGGADLHCSDRPHARAGVPATDGETTHAAPPFSHHADDGGAGSR